MIERAVTEKDLWDERERLHKEVNLLRDIIRDCPECVAKVQEKVTILQKILK